VRHAMIAADSPGGAPRPPSPDPMTPDELGAFLEREWPTPLGVVGTIRADGSPHVVPVWFRWDGAAVQIWSGEGRAWVRNVRRDPRVAFSVQEERPPFAALVMRGRAEVASDDGPGIAAEIRRITRRYIEPHEVDAYVREWAALQTIVRIHPDSVTGWNRGY
jgi:PPOX class probable F420-dependent enzyme